MRQILKITSIIIMVLFAVHFQTNGNASSGPKLYTAYNIWEWSGFNMKCINYKGGRSMIPAGTEILDPKVTDYCTNPTDCTKVIRFKLASNKKKYKIFFTPAYHPGKTIKDYKNNMFTAKNFEELTAGLTQQEKTAIKTGVIQNGMSKKAVLISYGPPPEHATPNLNGNVWLYWKNKRKTEKILFNSKNRTGPENVQGNERKQETAASIEEKFLALKRLLDKGLITQDEYDKKKAELLENM
ncbi:MAG: SHOCT domain-containing protein [Deltaproteobacteria bacterium]|nr:SHOCT domain-containing protein [Deltaproteobacteria bacterium]MBT8357278.1 SHOCT domain-containing protein [Deltaproteobacteria bacterium]